MNDQMKWSSAHLWDMPYCFPLSMALALAKPRFYCNLGLPDTLEILRVPFNQGRKFFSEFEHEADSTLDYKRPADFSAGQVGRATQLFAFVPRVVRAYGRR